MTRGFQTPITIIDAIRAIDTREFLLPAIQRRFVWRTRQITALFDSLMRDYPIGTFMMWDVTSPDIKNQYAFYDFLPEYCERFREKNARVTTKGDFHDFKAVIDGQQRLNSLYIGLKGTYAYKQPRVWWPSAQDDSKLPPRRLYLNLSEPLTDEDDDEMLSYEFRFLTDHQYETSKGHSDKFWYPVGDILPLPDQKNPKNPTEALFQVVTPFVQENGLEGNTFAVETLARLFSLVHFDEVIRYYNETDQRLDHVLDVFIRTNSGGTPLSFSALLMSILVANWDGDAREDIDSLVELVRQSDDMGYFISRDWILKTCLMVTDSDVRFRVGNFTQEKVMEIQSQWGQLRDAIVAAFRLTRLLGLPEKAITAKNAIVPIVYFVYHKKDGSKALYETINKISQNRETRKTIGLWLHMALLKGVFGGQSDSVLRKMRSIIKSNLSDTGFPLDAIVDSFAGSSKDLRFDEEYLQGLCGIQHGEPRCRPVLSLLFPEVNENQVLHIDHLHPASAFSPRKLQEHDFLRHDEELMKFFRDKTHWNSIVNLHLLNDSQNLSKKDKGLEVWINDPSSGFRREDLLLDSSDSLRFEDFREFYEKRRAAILERLRNTVRMTDVVFTPVVEDEDEEEVAYVGDEALG